MTLEANLKAALTEIGRDMKDTLKTGDKQTYGMDNTPGAVLAMGAFGIGETDSGDNRVDDANISGLPGGLYAGLSGSSVNFPGYAKYRTFLNLNRRKSDNSWHSTRMFFQGADKGPVIRESHDNGVTWDEGFTLLSDKADEQRIKDHPGKVINVVTDLFLNKDGNDASGNYDKLNTHVINNSGTKYYFPPGLYRFSDRLSVKSNQVFYGDHRDLTTLSWPNNTIGIYAWSSQHGVQFYGLHFTNEFDITQHDNSQSSSTTGQYPLVYPDNSGCDSWVFTNCRFSNTYRQAIYAYGPHRRWIVRNNVFTDTAREALFVQAHASQGPAWGFIVTENHFYNQGDDVVNFRNAYCNIFANNYLDQRGVNHSGDYGQGFISYSHACMKVHGDYNLFANNVVNSGGNKVFDAQSSDPGNFAGASKFGYPKGNWFIGNTIRYTETLRKEKAPAISVHTSEGGHTHIRNNSIEWHKDASFFEFAAIMNGFPSDGIINTGPIVTVQGNFLRTGERVMHFDPDSKFEIVEFKDNHFHELEGNHLVAPEDNTRVTDFKFIGNTTRYRDGTTGNGTVFMSGVNNMSFKNVYVNFNDFGGNLKLDLDIENGAELNLEHMEVIGNNINPELRREIGALALAVCQGPNDAGRWVYASMAPGQEIRHTLRNTRGKMEVNGPSPTYCGSFRYKAESSQDTDVIEGGSRFHAENASPWGTTELDIRTENGQIAFKNNSQYTLDLRLTFN